MLIVTKYVVSANIFNFLLLCVQLFATAFKRKLCSDITKSSTVYKCGTLSCSLEKSNLTLKLHEHWRIEWGQGGIAPPPPPPPLKLVKV